jgi:hypothetical protein
MKSASGEREREPIEVVEELLASRFSCRAYQHAGSARHDRAHSCRVAENGVLVQ